MYIDNEGQAQTVSACDVCVTGSLGVSFWCVCVVQQCLLKPTEHIVSRWPSRKREFLPASLFSPLSLSLSLWVSQSGHPAHQYQMAKRCSTARLHSLSLLPCTAHDLLRGGTVCSPVRACVCSLPLLRLLRDKHPLIRASTSVICLLTDGTMAHERKVRAEGLTGTSQRLVCVCMHAINSCEASVIVRVLSYEGRTVLSQEWLEISTIAMNERWLDLWTDQLFSQSTASI